MQINVSFYEKKRGPEGPPLLHKAYINSEQDLLVIE